MPIRVMRARQVCPETSGAAAFLAKGGTTPLHYEVRNVTSLPSHRQAYDDG